MQINSLQVAGNAKQLDNPSQATKATTDGDFGALFANNLQGVIKELNADLMDTVGSRFNGSDDPEQPSRPEGAAEGVAMAPPSLMQSLTKVVSSDDLPASQQPYAATQSVTSSPQKSVQLEDQGTQDDKKTLEPAEDGASATQNAQKKEEVAAQQGAAKQNRELGSLIQAAADKSAADPGSFASLATARFAAMRQDQRQIVEALRSSEKTHGLQGALRTDSATPAFAPSGAATVGSKNGLGLTQEVFGRSATANLQNDDNKKVFEVFFDRKANSANISLNHDRHGQIKLKVDVNGNEVQLTLLSRDADVQQLIGNNIQSLKDQLSQKGLTLSFGFEGQPGREGGQANGESSGQKQDSGIEQPEDLVAKSNLEENLISKA